MVVSGGQRGKTLLGLSRLIWSSTPRDYLGPLAGHGSTPGVYMCRGGYSIA